MRWPSLLYSDHQEIVTESPTRIRPEVVTSQKIPSSGMMQYPMVRPIMHGA